VLQNVECTFEQISQNIPNHESELSMRELQDFHELNWIKRTKYFNDERAFSKLADRYMNIIKFVANKFFVHGGENEDLVQEGLFGLFKAVKVYEPDKGSLFKSIAFLCIRRSILQIVRTENSKKALVHHSSISLNKQVFEENDGSLLDVIPSYQKTPADILIEEESVKELRERIEETLSLLEIEVFKLLIDEKLSYSQIAEDLNVPIKSVDNAIQRIKRKSMKVCYQI